MSTFPIFFDPDHWVRVPLEWAAEQWADPAEWADWVAESASSGRANADELRDRIRSEARAIAEFPSDRVAARFWSYPIDGAPNGWVDLFAWFRPTDGTPIDALLPELDGPLLDPVVEPFVSPFERALRRLSLIPLGEAALGAGRSGVLAKAEWIAAAGDWVLYARSTDPDPRLLTARLAETDRLVAGVDAADLARLTPESTGR